MLNKTQLIEKLNFHFPSYGAKDGSGFADASILFTGENAAANLLHNDLGDGVCPVSLYLNRHGWYVEHYDEGTALAFKCPKAADKANAFNRWDMLVEKSKTVKLTEDEKQQLKALQKQMLNTLSTGK